MEFYKVEKLNDWYIKIKLPYIDRARCSYNQQILKYIYAIGRYVKDTELQYLYQEEVNDGEFIFQIGYAAFILNEFRQQLDLESINLLENIIFSDDKLPYFINLTNHQNDDLQLLAQYKRGMFQVFTGYGKTEVIATLANYIVNTLHEHVLIVTPSSVALDEIKYRLYDRFNIDLDYFDYESNINAINLNGFLRSGMYDNTHEYWSNNFWILADEVEHCCSESAMEFFESLHHVKRMYGFSATADKKNAEPIYSRVSDEFLNSDKLLNLTSATTNVFNNRQLYCKLINEESARVRDIMGRNKYLVGYFGTSVVFKKPSKFNITLIDIMSTISSDDIEIPKEYDYNEIIYSLFTDDRLCRLLESIVFKEGMTFIPMFRLQVVDYWIDNYFKKKDFLVLVISGRGYELYENGVYLNHITMEEMKRLVKLGMIGVILGTRSSYGAMDLPELNRSILLYSKVANIVIQAIGRTARGEDFEIISIVPSKTIPTYTKDLLERKELIKSYYENCKIIEVKRNENFYGV